MTALHMAAGNGNSASASCAVALLEAGAAVDAEDFDDSEEEDDPVAITPLMIETWGRSQSRVIPVLLRYGADLDRALSGTRAPHRRPVNKLYLERVQAAGGWKRYATSSAENGQVGRL